MRETLLAVVNGTGEGYSTPAETDIEAIQRIKEWNCNNITEIWEGDYWGSYFPGGPEEWPSVS